MLSFRFRLKTIYTKNFIKFLIEGVDITRQPCNRIYYEHVVNPDSETDSETTVFNDFHVRNQLLAQYKYKSEKSKTLTFFIITIVSYVMVFPVFVLHFSRTYENENGAGALQNRGVYTAFVWISYSLIVVKALLCLAQNRFYRNALYQSANCKGFSGVYDFQHELKQAIGKIDNIIEKI